MDKLTKDNKSLKEDMEIVQREITHTQLASSDVRILQAKIEYYQVRLCTHNRTDRQKSHTFMNCNQTHAKTRT